MAPHKTGVWIDDATDEVVYSAPNRGTQIVRKGGEVSSSAKGLLAARGLDAKGVDVPATSAAPVTVDTADDGADETDDEKTVTGPKAKATKNS